MSFDLGKIKPGAHICLIYSDAQEQGEVVSKFLAGGLLQNEKVSYFSDAASRDDILAWVREMGLDESELTTEAFDLFPTSAAYYPEGHFSLPAMYERIETFAASALETGYSAARLTGEASWALKGIPGSERLLEYEEGINKVLPKCGVTAMCQYDATMFDSSFLMKVIKVHPMMVINKTLVKNPYFVTGH